MTSRRGRADRTWATGGDRRRLADGGEPAEDEEDGKADPGADAENETEDAASSGSDADEEDPTEDPLDRANVEVTDAGASEPADPKWEKPDLDDIPEFETGVDEPMARHAGESTHGEERGGREDPTAGRPNTARSPGDSRIKREGTEGYVAALELCARLPEDVRLPAEAADLVPAAVEAELENDIQSFAAAEFDNPSPHVDALDFVERDGEIWLRLRLGVPPGAFDDLDPEEIRNHALQELEGLL